MSDSHRHDHEHSHGGVDPALFSSVAGTAAGIRAIKWSLLGLGATAIIQVAMVVLSGSVALLADTVHNFGDAATAIPLWVAFSFARMRPGRRFTYGYGRVEDFAGLAVVLLILASALVAGYTSIERLLNPRDIAFPWVVMSAGFVGFVGNEAVALLRITVGKRIGSAALVADGYHARVDGFTSLAVVFSATGMLLGLPLLDPIIGLLITAVIFRVLWTASRPVVTRLLDGVEPETIERVRHLAGHAKQVVRVSDVRARWVGHELQGEVSIAVHPGLTVEEAHRVADEVQHELLHEVPHLAKVAVHVDPADIPGERFHVTHHQGDAQPHHHHPAENAAVTS